MKRDMLNRPLLNKMTDEKLAARSRAFNSPGTLGRRKPQLKLVGPLAQGLNELRPGTGVRLNVSGTVVATGTKGQRPEATVEVASVDKVRR